MNTNDIFGVVSHSDVNSIADDSSTARKALAKTSTKAGRINKVVAAASKKEVARRIYIQYADRQTDEDTIVNSIIEQVKNMDINLDDMQVRLYIKPEDNSCYYVINDTIEGKVNLF